MKTISLSAFLHTRGFVVRYAIKQSEHIPYSVADLYFDNIPWDIAPVLKYLTLKYYSASQIAPRPLFKYAIECRGYGTGNRLYKYFQKI
jgi:hypothetical protein